MRLVQLHRTSGPALLEPLPPPGTRGRQMLELSGHTSITPSTGGRDGTNPPDRSSDLSVQCAHPRERIGRCLADPRSDVYGPWRIVNPCACLRANAGLARLKRTSPAFRGHFSEPQIAFQPDGHSRVPTDFPHRVNDAGHERLSVQ